MPFYPCEPRVEFSTYPAWMTGILPVGIDKEAYFAWHEELDNRIYAHMNDGDDYDTARKKAMDEWGREHEPPRLDHDSTRQGPLQS